MRKSEKPKKLEGKISITRVHCNTYDDYVSIELEDGKSSCIILAAEVSLLEFANAIINLSSRPCMITHYNAPIGKKRETKSEFIELPKIRWDLKKEEQSELSKKLLEPYEVDGWEARSDDLWNHHNQTTKQGITTAKVLFVRFVEDEDETDR